MPSTRPLASPVALAVAAALAAPVLPAQQPAAGADSLEEVVVRGYRAQNQLAIDAKRGDLRIAEYLLSDDIGQQPDYNIADSFRRVPGVQTIFDEDEGRYVSIRGLNPSYTLGSMDGATLATAERGSRQLNMEAIPSTAVRSLEVIKSRTPDVDGNAIGGTINLVTRSAFDSDATFAALNAFIGTADSKSVPGKGYGRSSDDGINYRADGSFSTIFGADDAFGVVLSGSFSRKRRDQERLLPQQVPPNTGNFAGTTPAGTANLLWSNYPNSVDRYGGLAKFEFRPSDAFRSSLSATYYVQEDNELRHSLQLLNTAGGSFVRFNDFPIEKPLVAGNADFAWDVADQHRVSGRVSYSAAQFLEPSNELQFTLTGAAPTFNLRLVEDGIAQASNVDPRVSDPAQYRFSRYAPYEDDSDEYISEGQLDYGFNTERGDAGFGFQAGIKWRELTRDNDRRQDIFLPATATDLRLTPFNQAESYVPIYADFRQLFIDYTAFEAFFKANPALFLRDSLNSTRQTVGSDWQLTETVTAAYLLGQHKGERHSLVIGGRFESTDTDARTVQRRAVGTADVFTTQSRSGGYDDFLPSVTFGYELAEGLRLRLAYAEAVGRPDPSALAGAETVAANGDLSRGNPDLKARKGRSYDAALEYYAAGGGSLMSIGLFRKDVDDEIYSYLEQESLNGVVTNVTQPRNAESARITGLELNMIQNRLGFLPGFLANFGFSANATFLDGKTTIRATGARRDLSRLPGQAEFLGNVAVFYEAGGFRARLSYAYTGEYSTAVSATSPASDRTEGDFQQLDAQLRYALGERLELIGEVRNLSDERRINFTGAGQDVARDVNQFGRQFWIGAAMKF